MAREHRSREDELSRRAFLVTTGGALVSMAAFGSVERAAAAKRHPQRGGTLLYGSSLDIAGLDAHRNNQNHRVHATAAMFNGLTDIDQRGHLVPSLAESWEPNKELTTWTFRLRKGVLFHNGREVDAEVVKLNILRIQDPAIGHDFIRGGLENVESVDQVYPRGDPWHLEGVRILEYDPDKAKALLREARAVGTQVKLIAGANAALARETVEVIQAAWDVVGLKAKLELLDTAPLIATRKAGNFDASLGGYTYRYDPDDFYARNLHSKSEWNKVFSGWQNARYDQLVEAAKRTLDMARRKELYTEAQNIVNVELPHFHLHDVVRITAAVKDLQGYEPGSGGAVTYQGGGLRTAYIAA